MPTPDQTDGTVNDQITDSAAQAQELLLGQAASQGMSIIDAVMAETLGMAMHNAVSTQQKMQMLNSAAVTATLSRILNAGPPPAVPPPAPAPAPGPEPSPSGGGDSSGIVQKIASDTTAAQVAVGKLVADLSTASAGVSDAQKSLKDIADEADKGSQPASGKEDGGGSGGGEETKPS